MGSSHHGCRLLHHGSHGHTSPPRARPPQPAPAPTPAASASGAVAVRAVTGPVVTSSPDPASVDTDVWGRVLRSGPPDAGLLQDALHGFYPSITPRAVERRKELAADAPAAAAVKAKQEGHEAFAVASPCAVYDVDADREYPMAVPRGLLEDMIQYPPFVESVAAPPAATRHGRRRG